MSYVDQETANSVDVTEPVQQAICLTMLKRNNITQVTIEGDVDAMMQAFGIRDHELFHSLLHQIANAGAPGRFPDEIGMKFMLGFIEACRPWDEISVHARGSEGSNTRRRDEVCTSPSPRRKPSGARQC